MARLVIDLWEDGGIEDGVPFPPLRLWTVEDRGKMRYDSSAVIKFANQYLGARFDDSHPDPDANPNCATTLKNVGRHLPKPPLTTWWDMAAEAADEAVAARPQAPAPAPAGPMELGLD